MIPEFNPYPTFPVQDSNDESGVKFPPSMIPEFDRYPTFFVQDSDDESGV
jgi:hypothetical protein